jgi:hypothetical protein
VRIVWVYGDFSPTLYISEYSRQAPEQFLRDSLTCIGKVRFCNTDRNICACRLLHNVSDYDCNLTLTANNNSSYDGVIQKPNDPTVDQVGVTGPG